MFQRTFRRWTILPFNQMFVLGLGRRLVSISSLTMMSYTKLKHWPCWRGDQEQFCKSKIRPVFHPRAALLCLVCLSRLTKGRREVEVLSFQFLLYTVLGTRQPASPSHRRETGVLTAQNLHFFRCSIAQLTARTEVELWAGPQNKRWTPSSYSISQKCARLWASASATLTQNKEGVELGVFWTDIWKLDYYGNGRGRGRAAEEMSRQPRSRTGWLGHQRLHHMQL